MSEEYTHIGCDKCPKGLSRASIYHGSLYQDRAGQKIAGKCAGHSGSCRRYHDQRRFFELVGHRYADASSCQGGRSFPDHIDHLSHRAAKQRSHLLDDRANDQSGK